MLCVPTPRDPTTVNVNLDILATDGLARGVPRTVASVKESPPFASLVRGNPSKPRENTHLVKKQQLPMTRDYKRNLKYFRVDQHFNLCLTRLERIWTPAFPLGLN